LQAFTSGQLGHGHLPSNPRREYANGSESVNYSFAV
jgi:hypothetical protein